MKPVIGITVGDPAGIGPEVALKALSNLKEKSDFLPLLIGDLPVLKKNSSLLSLPLHFEIIETGVIKGDFPVGEPDRLCGKAAYSYIKKGVNLLKEGKIAALVTAPVNKEGINLAGYRFSGHTEVLARAFKVKNFGMVLASNSLRVLLVTTHLPLKEVPTAITKEAILKKILLGNKFLKEDMEIRKPKIGLCGLNPHSGEGGVLGDEEEKIISPAIKEARKKGIECSGPFPSDTLFFSQKRTKEFDLILAMYHDQGLIPLKTLYFERLVNITIGLSVIRTSPGHGTGYDIAYQKKADSRSMEEAILWALYLSKKRRKGEWKKD